MAVYRLLASSPSFVAIVYEYDYVTFDLTNFGLLKSSVDFPVSRPGFHAPGGGLSFHSSFLSII